METSSRNKIYRIGALWMTIAFLAGGALFYATNLPSVDEQAAPPKRLDDIELVATATSFDEFIYTGQNNLLRGNFSGSLFSTSQTCQANRLIVVWKAAAGSVPAVRVAASISDNTGATGNFTTTEYEDPPTAGDQYYAIVEPEGDCLGAQSNTLTL